MCSVPPSAATRSARPSRPDPRLGVAPPSTRGADFRASIAGAPTTDRPAAAELLRTWAAANLTPYGSAVTHDHPHGVIAHLGGHDITATEVSCARGQRPDIHLSLAHVPRSTWAVTHDAMTGPTIGVLRQMENHAADVPQLAPRVRHERAAAEEVAAEGRAALQRPFKYTADLATAREKVREINTIVAGRRADTQLSATLDGSQPPPALTERISALHDAADDLTTSITTNPTATIPVHGLAARIGGPRFWRPLNMGRCWSDCPGVSDL